MNFSRSYTFSGKSAIWGAALIFTAAGIIFTFLVPGILAGDAADRIAAGGTVVELAEDNGMRYPVVEFKTVEGRTVTIKSGSGSGGGRPAVGDSIDIMYRKGNVHDIVIPADTGIMKTVSVILGSVLLFIGVVILLLCFALLCVQVRYPQNEEVFIWWINFTGGMTGALSFSLPSTLIYPLFKLLPQEMKNQAQNTGIMLPVFTAVGILVNIAIFFIARSQLRGRPEWKS